MIIRPFGPLGLLTTSVPQTRLEGARDSSETARILTIIQKSIELLTQKHDPLPSVIHTRNPYSKYEGTYIEV